MLAGYLLRKFRLAENCVRFYPKATATFTLIASGDGGTDRKAFSVTVR